MWEGGEHPPFLEVRWQRLSRGESNECGHCKHEPATSQGPGGCLPSRSPPRAQDSILHVAAAHLSSQDT